MYATRKSSNQGHARTLPHAFRAARRSTCSRSFLPLVKPQPDFRENTSVYIKTHSRSVRRNRRVVRMCSPALYTLRTHYAQPSFSPQSAAYPALTSKNTKNQKVALYTLLHFSSATPEPPTRESHASN